jgi:hypothetical protein
MAESFMTRACLHLFRLYPIHVRTIYGDEMLTAFQGREASAHLHGKLATMRLALGELCRVLPDAACERIAMLSSHPSFRGPCLPDPGVVRPPNVGKKEWFYGGKD